MLFGKDFTPVQRQIAKTANFGLLYGAGVNVFLSILIKDAGILLTEEEGAAIKRKWRMTYPTIAKWQDQGASDWRHGKAWKTPFGRKYTAKMMTDQLNICNQGFGAEVAKLAMHYMEPEVRGCFGKDVFMADFVHDSFIYDCPADEEVYQGTGIIVADSMQKAWFEALRTGIDLKIRDLPMPVDVFVGYNWGRIEDDYLYKYTLDGMKHYEQL
jgi:DNA polymerase I-like protein with 3'-5' exonuclease and polymerase domains